MHDFLDTLAMDAAKTIDSGYYKNFQPVKQEHNISYRQNISSCKKNAVIAEIKAASPSLGTIRENIDSQKIAASMERAGATGISVLTEPKHFNGSLATLAQARETVKLPILMKDILLVSDQIDVAQQIGANAVLLIQALFDRKCCEMNVDKMIAYAHGKGLEVLLETHTQAEFKIAIETDADLIGINNRDLSTLKIDLNTTKQILENYNHNNKIIVTESGIKTPSDLKLLRSYGADAFLIGSSIMLSDSVEEKIREFVNA
jgi:indole-3-glycerol phosphate synthase